MTKIREDYTTGNGKREENIWTAALILVLGILIGVAMCCIQALAISAQAEDAEPADAWIICQPADWVNARSRASRKGEIVGRMLPEDRIRTDGKKKAGFLHCYASLEQEDCWIFAGYVTTEKPEKLDREYMICAPGRVACRKWIDGPRKCWVREGDLVTVYYWTPTWCVTNRGFIRSEYVMTGR